MLKQGAASSHVSINTRVSWKTTDTTRSQYFTFNDSLVNNFLNTYVNVNGTEKYNGMFTLSISNVDKYENLKFEVVVRSSTGVEIASSAIGITDDDNEEDSTETITPKIIDVSYAGEEKYDLVTDGAEPTLKLNVTYSDNKTEKIEITSDMYVIDDTYVKPNFQSEGTYNAKVDYKGFTVTFTVKVIDPNILIRSEEFTYGSYFDHDRFTGNTGTRLTSGDYIKIRSADALLPAQEITIKVTNTDTTNYKVTLGF